MQYGYNPLYTPENVFAIADIQGGADVLENLLAKILPHFGEKDHIVFVGDLLDGDKKGPEVLKIIADLKAKFPGRVFVVRGNHEQMVLQYIRGNPELWFANGGMRTLHQFEKWGVVVSDLYNTKLFKSILEKEGVLHVLEDTIQYYETESLIITHAPLDRTVLALYGGLNTDSRKSHGVLERMSMEIQWQFLDDERKEIPEIKKYLICGHQFGNRSSSPRGEPRVFNTRAFIDCGAGYKHDRPLACLKFPEKLVFLSDIIDTRAPL